MDSRSIRLQCGQNIISSENGSDWDKVKEIYCTVICLKYSNKKVVRDDTNDGK